MVCGRGDGILFPDFPASLCVSGCHGMPASLDCGLLHDVLPHQDPETMGPSHHGLKL